MLGITKLGAWWIRTSGLTESNILEAPTAINPPAAVQLKSHRQDVVLDQLSIRTSGDASACVLSSNVCNAFKKALALETKLPVELLDMEGMSGRKYRSLINNLISEIHNARYLEIGSWLGSTACAAMNGNRATVVCIDNWTEFGGPKEGFFENIQRFKTSEVNFAFRECDFRVADYGSIGTFNVFLFDGPHGHEDQYQGLALPLRALDDDFIFIVDDWNAPFVRSGTERAIEELGLLRLYEIEIRTTQNDEHAKVARQHSDWHNGYHIGVYRKPPNVSSGLNVVKVSIGDIEAKNVTRLASCGGPLGGRVIPFFEDQSFDFEHVRPHTCPPMTLNISTLEDVFILVGPGRDGVVFDSAGRAISETCSHTDFALGTYTLDYLTAQAQSIDVPLFLAFDASWRNYYHWTIIGLGKAMLYKRLCENGHATVVFDRAERDQETWRIGFSQEVWEASLRRASVTDNSLVLKCGVYKVQSLDLMWIADEAGRPVDQSSYVSFFSEFSRGFKEIAAPPTAAGAINLVIARPHDPRLSPDASDALDRLERHAGFKFVVLEDLSFKEQLDLFASANLIVSPHGAGLANLVYAPASTKVVELHQRISNEETLRPWFYIISACMSQNYSYCDLGTVTAESVLIYNRLVELTHL